MGEHGPSFSGSWRKGKGTWGDGAPWLCALPGGTWRFPSPRSRGQHRQHRPQLPRETSPLPTHPAGSHFELPKNNLLQGSLMSLLQPGLHQQGREVAEECCKGLGSVALGVLLNKASPGILAGAAGSAQKPGKLNDIIWVPLTDGISTQALSAWVSAEEKSVAREHCWF